MIWALIAAGFFLAATMGAALASLFTTMKPEWSRKRRLFTAASVLPAITLAAGLGFALLSFLAADASIRGPVFIVISAWTAGFALLGLAGGFLGALTSFKARRG